MKMFLANGCSCSQISVFPKTWERSNASIKKKWYIHYRFYDPTYPKKTGYLKVIKRMNEYKTLEERQRVTRDLVNNELYLLRDCQYNPITETFLEPEKVDYIVDPQTGLISALEKALERMEGVQSWKDDIKSNLRFLKPAAEQLRFASIPIKDIRRRHIIMLLDQCGKNKDIWTAATYNRYRRNLGSLFSVLVEIEAIDYNPIDKHLKTKKETKQLKEILTREEIILINTKLREINYFFWRFIHIFCNSGARTTEIMKVQLKDVDLEKQTVKYMIRKGHANRVVLRPIKDDVLYLWEQLVIEAKQARLDGDAYLFSASLKPGIKPIRADQIRHRWRTWVQRDPDTSGIRKCGRKTVYPRKAGLGIKKSWYPLKHLNTDLMESMYGSDITAHLNQHDKSMVENIYAVNREERMNQVIRKAPNPLAITQ